MTQKLDGEQMEGTQFDRGKSDETSWIDLCLIQMHKFDRIETKMEAGFKGKALIDRIWTELTSLIDESLIKISLIGMIL